MKIRFLSALIALICFFTTGCSSLVDNVDLDKVTVKELDFKKLYGIDEIREKVSSYGDERYNIDGTDAFYILPNGVPEPEAILDFQVVDFLNETTLVYAYQSLYDLTDPTGRGGKDKTGVRPLKEGRTVGEQAPKDAEDKSPWEQEDEGDKKTGFSADTVTKMVTVYMAYNTETGAYNVFGSFVNDVEVKTESRFGVKNTYVYMKPVKNGILSMDRSGMTAEEINPLFTQKVNDGYFLYHWGSVYLYDRSGRVVYYQNLDEARSLMTGGGNESEIYFFNGMMIENVFMDTRYHVYIQCSRPKESTPKETKNALNTDPTAEQSEDEIEDEEPGVSQSLAGTDSTLYEISMVNLGRMQDEKPDADYGYRYFVSENKNYEEELARLQGLDGGTVYFDGEPDQADADRWLENEKEKVLAEKQPSYEVYHFYQDLFPYKLYYCYGDTNLQWIQETGVPDTAAEAYGRLKNDKAECYELRPDTLNETLVNVFKDTENGYYPFAYLSENSSQRSLIPLKGYFDSVEFDPQRRIEEPVTVHINAVWGAEKAESKEFDCTVRLPREYRLSFYSKRGYANITSGMISAKAVPSGDAGYLKLSTTTTAPGSYSSMTTYLLRQLWPDIFKYYTEEELSRRVSTEQVIEGTAGGRVTTKYPTIAGETARNILSVGTSDSNGKQKEKFVIQSNKTLMVLLGERDVAMVNVPMLMFDTYGDVMNVDYSQPEHNENDTTGSYLAQGLKLYQDEDGIWWLYAASPEKGILKVNLNNSKQFQTFLRASGFFFSGEAVAVQNKEMIEKNAARESTGQISAYPYYCLWLDDDGKGCYALGFQNTAYSYDAKDLCGAKIYHISFTDEEAAANLAYSSARKNPEFQKAYAAKDVEGCRKWWISNIEALDLAKEPEMVTAMTNYFDFLAESLVSRDKGYSSFAQITAKSAGNQAVSLNEEEVKQLLASCNTYQDVERLMVEYRTDLVDVENPFESAEDPFKRIDRDWDQTKSEKEESGTEAAAMETVIPTGEAVKPSISDEDASRFSGDASYQGQKETIIRRLKELNGYTSNEAWIADLQKIADDMHPATTYSEYKSVQKKKEAELAAKSKAEQEKAAKEQEAREAELQKDLEKEKKLRDQESVSSAESLKSAESAADKAAEEIGRRIEESKRTEESKKAAESSKAMEESKKKASSEAERESMIRASIEAERGSLSDESRKALEELESMFSTAEETLEISTELEDEEPETSEGGPGYLEPEETLPQ